jgi:hypothetical protein
MAEIASYRFQRITIDGREQARHMMLDLRQSMSRLLVALTITSAVLAASSMRARPRRLIETADELDEAAGCPGAAHNLLG